VQSVRQSISRSGNRDAGRARCVLPVTRFSMQGLGHPWTPVGFLAPPGSGMSYNDVERNDMYCATGNRSGPRRYIKIKTGPCGWCHATPSGPTKKLFQRRTQGGRIARFFVLLRPHPGLLLVLQRISGDMPVHTHFWPAAGDASGASTRAFPNLIAIITFLWGTAAWFRLIGLVS
jgi:hypothetical protein